MNGVLVATESGNMVYLVIDQGVGENETGAVVGRDGVVHPVPFWDWVNSKADLKELHDNGLQHALWTEPGHKDHKLWSDVFVERKSIIDPSIWGDIPVVQLSDGKKPSKKRSDTIDAQTKVAQIMMNLLEARGNNGH